jgi:integrase/recombinase XerD
MDTFEKAINEFVASLRGVGRSENTLDAYRSDLAQFAAYAQDQGATVLDDLTVAHVVGWMTALAERGLAPASRARKLNAVRSFAKHLLLVGQVEKDFTLGVSAPKANAEEPRVLSRTETKALQGVCRDDPRDAAIIEVMLQTGIRVGELVALTLDDLVWHENRDTLTYLVVRHGKGDKFRRVPLNTRAERLLRDWLKVRPESSHTQLFLSKRRAMPLYSADVRAMLRKYYSEAGILGASAHTLRHTFCTHHAAAGTNLVVIQRAAGHASLTTTQRYLHLVDRMMEDAMERNAL